MKLKALLPAIAVLLVAVNVQAGGLSGGPHHRAGSSKIAQLQAAGLSVSYATPEELVACILGRKVSVSNITFAGAPVAAGLFTGGFDILGIESGIVLSTGDAISVIGPNMFNDVTTDNQEPGDPDLDALIPGYETFDRAVLEFDFECEDSLEVTFDFVFSSDEYNEWVNSPYNDVFGFFLNGTAPADNIAAVPTFCDTPFIPVSINNVNCGNPFGSGGPNCNCFRNNDLNYGGGSINTEMDGLTEVFYVYSRKIKPGLNHLKIAIADAGDHILDSNVFIECHSFSCEEPASSKTGTWGAIKALYR